MRQSLRKGKEWGRKPDMARQSDKIPYLGEGKNIKQKLCENKKNIEKIIRAKMSIYAISFSFQTSGKALYYQHRQTGGVVYERQGNAADS